MTHYLGFGHPEHTQRGTREPYDTRRPQRPHPARSRPGCARPGCSHSPYAHARPGATPGPCNDIDCACPAYLPPNA
jgi:hypothetical protein